MVKRGAFMSGYFAVVLISAYRIINETVSFDVFPFSLLINQNWALLPYLAASLVIGVLLFSDRGLSRRIVESKSVVHGIMIGLVVIAVGLVLLGTIPAIDNSADHDEATEAWNDALLDGQNPYDCANHDEYRVCKLTVLPGLALLSLPAFILGEVSLTSVIAIIGIILIILKIVDGYETRTFALATLGISVPFYFRLLSQSNYFEIVVLFLIGGVLLHEDRLMLSGTIFGILFATKTNAWPLLPVVAFHVFRSRDLVKFMKFIAPAGVIGSLLLLPFFIWNPIIFINEAPLGVASGHLDLPIPYATVLFPLLVASISIVAEYYSKSLFAGLLVGTATLSLAFPKRYAIFMTVFIIIWTVSIVESEETNPKPIF